jgi:hypothetical protein
MIVLNTRSLGGLGMNLIFKKKRPEFLLLGALYLFPSIGLFLPSLPQLPVPQHRTRPQQ